MQTDTAPTSLLAAARAVLRRVSVPFLLFGLLLVILLLLSEMLLLPQLTLVPVAGSLMDTPSLQRHELQLQADIRDAETKRTELVLPLQDPVYAALRDEKRSETPFLDVRRDILDVASSLDAGSPNAFAFDAFDYDPLRGTVRLQGRVRNVGPRSMTVLAAFADALRAAPFVSDLTPPTFSRETDAKGGFFSPFDFTFTLQGVPLPAR